MTRSIMVIIAGLTAIAAMPAAAKDAKSVSNPNGCKVFERPAGDNSGTLSSSVSAGNGQVTTSTTGGNGVTVHSGDGRSSSSVATTGSGGSTTVATGDGDCTIYVNPGQKR